MARFIIACILAVVGGLIGHFFFETTAATIIGAVIGFLFAYCGPEVLEAID